MQSIVEPAIDPNLQTIENELRKEIKRYTSLAKKNYAFAYVLAAILVGSSLAGAIGGLIFDIPPKVLGVFAGIPTVVAFAASVYSPQQKANWHYSKSWQLIALRRKVLFEVPSPANADDIKMVSERWSEIDQEYNKIWSEGLGLGLARVAGRPAN